MASKRVYDFVVVGGGTAGLTVASRLSEHPDVTVLVLEAGKDASDDPRVAVPAMWSAVLGTELDWDFVTVPQVGLDGRQIGHPQGRVLGGSSAINAEVFVPPSRIGLDAWERLGNTGWNWKSLSDFFRRSHTLHAPDPELQEHLSVVWLDEKSRGTDGPIQASFTGVVQDPLGKAWVDTFQSLGLSASENPFLGKGIGGWASPSSIDPKSKTRSYAVAYIELAKNRHNLEVVTDALVSRVDISTSSGESKLRATGVSFTTADDSNPEHFIEVRKEVILAAGAFQSPKILELSGIGHPGVLSKAEIQVKVPNTNVGENLQDHLMTGVSFEAADGVMTGDCLLRQEPQFVQASMQMYQEHKSGPLASGSIMSYAFLPILSSQLEKIDPGHQTKFDQTLEQYVQNSNEPVGDEPISTFKKTQADVMKELLQTPSEASASMFMLPAQVNLYNGPKQVGMVSDPKTGNFVSLGVSLLHPLSRGGSHITSADPRQPPEIDPRYLSQPLDLEVFSRHLMAVELLAESAPLSIYLKPDGKRAQPCGKLDTVDKAKAYIKETAMTNNHPVGTCAMLPREDGGVVDSRLKVYDVDGLRVVDASIMPLIPRCNTQTVVYAVAEKAADIVKEDWDLK